MRWFTKKFSVCTECGTHYDPVVGYEARWGSLCAAHRKPVMERDLRKNAVIAWATLNWEKLEEQYKKENETTGTAYSAAQQYTECTMAASQQSTMNSGLDGISALFGLGGPLK